MDEAKPSGFHFLPEYGDEIARAASSWASLEFYVADSIWKVAGVSPATGACLTTNIFSLHAKISTLLALLDFRKAPDDLIKKVKRFSDEVRGPTELRNRLIHDVWLRDAEDENAMAQIELTAAKKLIFTITPVKLQELKANVDKIEAARKACYALRKEIYGAVDNFAPIPEPSDHPLMNVR